MLAKLNRFTSAVVVSFSLSLFLPLGLNGQLSIPPAGSDNLFQNKVYPLLEAKCLACHGEDPQKIKGGLNMLTRDGLLKGGDNGPALVPGDPNNSPIFLAVTWRSEDLRMPPKENDRLSEEEILLLRQWIAAGAPWPDLSKTAPVADPRWTEDGTAGVVVQTSGGLSPQWNQRRYQPEDLWAYRPILRPKVPIQPPADADEAAPTSANLKSQISNLKSGENRLPPADTSNPIDAFIRQRLSAQGLTLAPRADKLTLIRRATFDLTGLPPTPDQVDDFLRDASPRAFDQLTQRLLTSPHYGEQQARHWLDVVRYADTSGFSNDYERPNAWRYRDYVIRSFNADKPYDRFLVEQLAGDELDATDPELLIAAGFLRMGPWEHTGMTVATVTRQQYLDDITHNIGAALLGQALRCAACHDHKFDPIPTRDYYRMQAIFATTQFAERDVPFLPEENTKSFHAERQRAERRLDEVKNALAAIRKKNADAVAALVKERGLSSPKELMKSDLSRRDNIGLSKQEISLRKIYEKRRDYFERELRRYEPYAFSVYSGAPNNYASPKLDNPVPATREGLSPVVQILAGGSLESPVAPVKPGLLSAMNYGGETTSAGARAAVPETVEGRRLALAKWIISRDNTLTARVVVNRVWQQHFGQGLISTPNNFGKMGGRPTHPELLDWLAAWFVEHGWSFKKLHALIMASSTYQQNGLVAPDVRRGTTPESQKFKPREAFSSAASAAIDPKNDLLSHFPPRRLAAEELRDAMLAVTDELNPEMGGPGVFPEINWEVAFQPRHIMGSVAPAYQPSPTPPERNRRTIYVFRYRTLSDPMLEVFNRPGSEISCERRDQTTVTPQASALLNSEFVHQRALAFAASLEREAETLNDRITLAFRRTYGRPPAADELQLCAAHVRKMTAHHRGHPPQPTALPTSVKRRMVEEMTGEDVFWIEELDVLKSYRRDLMPWDVGAETRALAEFCLVLLNSNEFLYVR